MQRLKQLNIPPSGALTPTSQEPRPPASPICNYKYNDSLFFAASSLHSSVTPPPLKKHHPDPEKDIVRLHDRESLSSAGKHCWKKHLFICLIRLMENTGKWKKKNWREMVLKIMSIRPQMQIYDILLRCV